MIRLSHDGIDGNDYNSGVNRGWLKQTVELFHSVTKYLIKSLMNTPGFRPGCDTRMWCQAGRPRNSPSAISCCAVHEKLIAKLEAKLTDECGFLEHITLRWNLD